MANHRPPQFGSYLLNALLAFGITVFFGVLGAGLALALMAWAISSASSTSDTNGVGLVLGGIYAVGLGFIVGLSIGLPISTFILKRSWGTWIGIPMATLSLIAIGAAWNWNHRVQSTAHESLVRVREHQAQQHQKLDSELAEFLRRAQADAPALYGELLYPGAEIWPTGIYDPQYPRLVLKAKERPSVVQDYYRSRLTDPRLEGKILRGSAIRVGDGRPLDVAVEPAGTGGTSVTIVTTGDPTPQKSPAEILASDPSWVPVTDVPEVTTLYAGMLYPGSRTNYPSIDHTRAPGMAVLMTADALDPVVAFYRPLVTVRQDEPTRFVGSVEPPDGKTRFIQIDRVEPFTRISFSGG